MMYSDSGDYSQLSLLGASEFKCKETKDWDGHDCLDWAHEAQYQLNIPISSWVSLDGFKYLTGRELLKYKADDFCRIVDGEYGPKFYKLFRKLVKERREDNDESDCLKRSSKNRYPSENNNWQVPDPNMLSPMNMSNSLSPCSYMSPELDNMCPSPIYQNTQNLYVPSDYSLYGLPSPSPEPAVPYLHDPLESKAFPEYEASCFDESDQATANDYSLEGMNLDFIDNDIIKLEEQDFSELDNFLHTMGEESHSLESLILETDQLRLQNPQNCQGFSMHPEVAATRMQDATGLGDKMLKKVTTGRRKNRTRNPRSWEFLVRLLIDPTTNPSLVRWENKEQGIFRLVKKDEIAKLWGSRSDRHKNEPLTYENFARILRYHYKSQLLHAVSEKHLVYRLGDKVLNSLRQEGVL